jgi:transposase
MSYIIEKSVNNNVYLYEVTSFWDPEKKQPRQKRKYLGKKDPETGQPVRARNQHIPRYSKDYGHVYLLQQLAEHIGLTQLLKHLFPNDDHIILALAFFEISEAVPLYVFPYWAESTVLAGEQPLSPKALSLFTEKIGRMEAARLDFSQHWIRKFKQTQAIFFDITSLSSYSKLFTYVEKGYNRDKERLPQINLGVIYAEQSHMPLYYQVYPGSIPDVSTLKNLLNYLELFDLKDVVFVMDRGFYSAANLGSMAKSHLTFLLPMPRSVNLFSSLLSQYTRQLSNLTHAFLFHDDVLFHVNVPTEINHVSLQAHLYFDPHSHSAQTTRFLKTILETEAAAKQMTFHTKKDARHYLSGLRKGLSQFFQVTGKTGQIEITRKTKLLSERIANMGATIMLTNHQELGRDNILELYRRKDYLEKVFDVLKNECDGRRLRSWTQETVEGRLFVKFISLILYSAVGNTMREQRLFKRYSIREIMYELKKIRIVEMDNGTSFLTEVSKRQREIFNKFNIEIPAIKT